MVYCSHVPASNETGDSGDETVQGGEERTEDGVDLSKDVGTLEAVIDRRGAFCSQYHRRWNTGIGHRRGRRHGRS